MATSSPISDFSLFYFNRRRVSIVFDSDSLFNPNIQAAKKRLAAELINRGANPFCIDLPAVAGTDKIGLDDFLTTAAKNGRAAFEQLPSTPLFMPDVKTASSLMQQDFPAPKWIIPGLIPVGLTILAGAPKIGKSWLALNLLASVTSGGQALGQFGTRAADAFYLALEDPPSRLQSRLRDLADAGVVADYERLYCETDWPAADNLGIQALSTWIEQHSCKLIIVDTLAKVRAVPGQNKQLYFEDYAAMAPLKRIADSNEVALVVIHHLRKAGASDMIDRVSGSTGITGAADTILVLDRARQAGDGTLHVTGRDIEEQSWALRFDEGKWTITGKAVDVQRSKTEENILAALREAGEPLSPSRIGEFIGKPRGSISHAIAKMLRDGVLLSEKGKYSVAASDPSATRKPPKF